MKKPWPPLLATLLLISLASCTSTGSSTSTQLPQLSQFTQIPVPLPASLAANSGNSACAQTSGVVVVVTCGGSTTGMKFVVYWEGAGSLSGMPTGITCVDLAFGTMSGSKVSFDPSAFGGASAITAGITAMHAKKVSVMLSIGGAGNPFSFSGDTTTYTSSLQAILQQYGFDGVDFDDEQDQGSARGNVISQLVTATQQMYTTMGKTNGLITLAAYGGSPSDFGDNIIIKNAGSALSWVNLMAYSPTLNAVEGMTTPYNGLIALNKIVVGGIDDGGDMGGAPSVSMGQQLATWSKAQGYGGVMMWTIDQGQQYVQPIATILGT